MTHAEKQLPSDVPRIEESVDANGIRTIVEYTTNDEGKRVKVSDSPISTCSARTERVRGAGQITRRIKMTLVKTVVEPAVAERKQWAKFGADKGKPAGPDRATTTVGEKIPLKLVAGGQKVGSHSDVTNPQLIVWC